MAPLNFALKLATLVSIVAGGLWAYFRYVRQRLGVWNLKMTITPDVLSYSGESAVLLLKVDLKNVGLISIVPGSKGCTVAIRRVPTGLRAGQAVTWKSAEPFAEEFDILMQYREPSGASDYENEVYALDLGGEYQEQHGVIVPRGFIYLIEVTFWARHNRDSVTEYSFCPVDLVAPDRASNNAMNPTAGGIRSQLASC